MSNHLWQSTLFAVVAGLLTLTLRGNRARVRYFIWLAASVKFLVPFALLVDAGSTVRWRTEPRPPILIVATERAGEMLAPVGNRFGPPGPPSNTPRILLMLWACGSVAVAARWLIRWRQANRGGPVLEPGVYGLFRPVVRMPEGIESKLTSPQLEAVMAHELAHARWRDNLTAASHMAVEVLFWFHPLVWWIGARLLDERERSCDEEVLRLGHDPDEYAEGIVRVCKSYLEMPVACVAGVTGPETEDRMHPGESYAS